MFCLASRSFLAGRTCEFPISRSLAAPPPTGGDPLLRRAAHLWAILQNQFSLAWQIVRRRPRLVLLDSYVEYLTPLWIWPHALLADLTGVRYAANLHDPVRSYQFGPPWWHRWSVDLAYRPLRVVLVHHPLPQPSPVPAHVAVVQVPVGVYDLPPARQTRAAVRASWGAGERHRVFLAFGFVRDGKNLDLAIRALATEREAFVVIAGSLASAKERPFDFYRNLARELGVADRVHLREGFVAEAEQTEWFLGADFILLTYSADFHSQSGVLNLAARVRKPVLASAAPSPLIAAVREYALGVAIEPDSPPAVVEGMRRLMQSPPAPRWDDYHRVASWESNAEAIAARLTSR